MKKKSNCERMELDLFFGQQTVETVLVKTNLGLNALAKNQEDFFSFIHDHRGRHEWILITNKFIPTVCIAFDFDGENNVFIKIGYMNEPIKLEFADGEKKVLDATILTPISSNKLEAEK